MPIVPDSKDWTWVLERPCRECGFDARTFDPLTTGSWVRRLGDQWGEVLDRPDVARRPDVGTWSPLEYACHVRDVFRVFEHRLFLMLTEDDPHYPNWDQDASAVDDRYDLQDPAIVADELLSAAANLAARFDAVPDDGWSRTGNRSDGACFTVDSFARYFVHDPIHHLHDVAPR